MRARISRVGYFGNDRRRRDARRQRLGQRDLQHLVHRGHQMQIERVEHVLRDIRQVLLVVAREAVVRNIPRVGRAANESGFDSQ